VVTNLKKYQEEKWRNVLYQVSIQHVYTSYKEKYVKKYAL